MQEIKTIRCGSTMLQHPESVRLAKASFFPITMIPNTVWMVRKTSNRTQWVIDWPPRPVPQHYWNSVRLSRQKNGARGSQHPNKSSELSLWCPQKCSWRLFEEITWNFVQKRSGCAVLTQLSILTTSKFPMLNIPIFIQYVMYLQIIIN